MSEQGRRSWGRPRVLIVEDDPTLAMKSVRACLEIGLEPKLCLGAERSTDCPGLRGEPCPRCSHVEATLISVVSGTQRIAAPACAGGRVVLAGTRPLLGAATVGVVQPDVCIDYPYDPESAALLLFSLVKDERRKRGWDHLRRGSVGPLVGEVGAGESAVFVTDQEGADA